MKQLITSGTVRGLPSTDWTNAKVYAHLGSSVQGILTGQMTVQPVIKPMDSDWG